MSRKGRQGRRHPSAPHQQQQRPLPQLVALPSPDARGVLRDGTTGGAHGGGSSVRLSDGSAPSSEISAYQLQSSRQPAAGTQYPPMPAISPDKPLLQSLGATGTAIFSGIITSEEYNADFYWKDAIVLYEQMIRNDAQIFAMTQLLELPIRRATWSIEPASDQPRDKEIASFVESCLFHDMTYTTSEKRQLTQKWDDILRHILMMLRFGFMAFEKCFRIDDGWVKWARWTPLLPRTIWRWWVGEDNELVGIQQWTFQAYTYKFVDIPADKLLLFVHRQEGNNYEGVSVLRSAYKHWYYKDNFYKIEAVDIERNAAQIPVVSLPENFTDADVTQAKAIMANMRVNEQMGVTMPPGWKIEYIRTFGKNTATVQPSIQHHDIMIARNILGQFLNLGSSETGSYALAQEQTATFLASLQAECEYVEDVINSDAIPELVNYNYEGVEVYPKLKASKVLAQDFDAIADALSKLTSSPSGPLIHGDAELEDFLRNELGLPKAAVSPVENTNPTAPSTPERPETDAAQQTAGSADATQESQTTQPTPGQEATSQAIANGAPDANTQSGQVQESGTAAREIATESRLLREALDAAQAMDAVEHGSVFLSGHEPGYTQNRGAHGRWGPGDGGGEHESGGSGGGGVHVPHGISAEHGVHARGASGGGGGSAGSGGGGTKAGTKGPRQKTPGAWNKERYAHDMAARNHEIDVKTTTGRERTLHSKLAELHRDAAGTANQIETLTSRKGEFFTRGREEALAHMTALETQIKASEGELKALQSSKAAKPAAGEGVHERSARLQREGGLKAEARPGGSNRLERAGTAPGEANFEFNPGAHIQPGEIARAFGEHQLGKVLGLYSKAKVEDAARSLGIQIGRSKAETISRITAHVTEGRYSANFGATGGAKASAAKSGEGSRSRSATTKSPEERATAKSTGKSAREQELERQVASLKAERDALKAQAGTTTATAKAARTGGTRASRAKAAGEEPLKAVTTSQQEPGLARRIDPYRAPDARFLRVLYGDHQLPRALSGFSHEHLNETAQRLGLRAGRSKADTVSRIVEHLSAEPHAVTVAKLRRATDRMRADVGQGGRYDPFKDYYAE